MNGKTIISCLAACAAAYAGAFKDCALTASFDGTEQKYLLSAPKDVSEPVDVLVFLKPWPCTCDVR